MVAGIFWARSKKGDEVCRFIDVEVVNDSTSTLVTPEGILRELESRGVVMKGLPMWQIDTDAIEQLLCKSEYLEQADCIKGLDGHVKIIVKQIVPVLRVFDGDASYYVNRDGKRMNASTNFHADVPIVQGHFTGKYQPTRLLPLIDFVENDSTLKQLVTMYSYNDSNNIILIPSIYGHVINIGNTENLSNKFRKLKLFYTKVMPEKGWKYYDTITVKWEYQIVATRANKARKPKDVYDPAQDEQDSVNIGTMSTKPVGEISKTALNARRAAQGSEPAAPAATESKKSESKKTAPVAATKPKSKEPEKKGKKP